MSICSIHGVKDPTCRMCKVDLRDDPMFMQKAAEAKAAGEHKCGNCSFLYYKTTHFCPLCGTLRSV